MKTANIKLADTQQRFYDFYKTNLQLLYQELEKERKLCLKKYFFCKNVLTLANIVPIIRLILKSGDQLFECFNFLNNGD